MAKTNKATVAITYYNLFTKFQKIAFWELSNNCHLDGLSFNHDI